MAEQQEYNFDPNLSKEHREPNSRRRGPSRFIKNVALLAGGAAAVIEGGGHMLMHAQDAHAASAARTKLVAAESGLPHGRKGGEDTLTINVPEKGKTIHTKLKPAFQRMFGQIMREEVQERMDSVLNEHPGDHVPGFYKADADLTLRNNGLTAKGGIWYGDHAGGPDASISSTITGTSSVREGSPSSIAAGAKATEITKLRLFINPKDKVISREEAANQDWTSSQTMQIAQHALNPNRFSVQDWTQTPYGATGIGTLHIGDRYVPNVAVTLAKNGQLTFKSSEGITANLAVNAKPLQGT